MVSPWPYLPGTLRALLATFNAQYVICRPCQRYIPMRIKDEDPDRKDKPCPFRCDLRKQRGEGMLAVPEGFSLIGQELRPPAHRRSF